jgi:hypothetical protein
MKAQLQGQIGQLSFAPFQLSQSISEIGFLKVSFSMLHDIPKSGKRA